MIFANFEAGTKIAAEGTRKLLGESLSFFDKLDSLYCRCVESLRQSDHNDDVWFGMWWLANANLNSMYNAFTSFLNGQLWMRLSAQRYGIECSLKAFYLEQNKESSRAFVRNDAPYRNIKRSVSEYILKGSGRWPLIERMLMIHETCSSAGVHPDTEGLFIDRFNLTKIAENNVWSASYTHFQIPKSAEFQFLHFHNFLFTYYLTIGVFRMFFMNNSPISIAAWDDTLGEVKMFLDSVISSTPIDSI